MPTYQLAICIPTYNRAPMLEHLLSDLTEQASRMDVSGLVIVISDNASTDHTQRIIQAYHGVIPLISVVQSTNVGGYNNLISAYRHANAEFSVYCADDDKIDLTIVKTVVQDLVHAPAIGAIFCPWMIESGRTGWRRLSYFKTIETTSFKKGEYKAALFTLLEHVLFPEIAVFRTEALKSLPPHSDVAFWFFLVFEKVLREWDVVIKDQSFAYYTSYLDHPAGQRQEAQMGNLESASAWDTYRGGLETFARLIQVRTAFTPVEYIQVILKINTFVANRQVVAMQSQCTMGNFVSALYLAQRIRLYLPEEVHDSYLNALKVGAAIEICYTSHFGTGIQRSAVLVGGFPKEFAGLVKRHGLSWFANDQEASSQTPRIYWSHADDKGALQALNYLSEIE